MTESPRCNFRPGQKVVCVDDYAGLFKRMCVYPTAQLPVKGAVYTVRDVNLAYSGRPQILLEEIRDFSPTYPDGRERGFEPRRFERAYDISIFHEICARVGKPTVEVFFEKISIR